MLFPLSAYGGGLVILPTEDAAASVVSVLDRSGTTAEQRHQRGVPWDGVLVGAEGRLTIKPFGLVGHQPLWGSAGATRRGSSLVQDPTNIANARLKRGVSRG